jgi:hypothetical protein
VGLDEDLHAFLEMQHQVKGALLLYVAISKGTTILKLLAVGEFGKTSHP